MQKNEARSLWGYRLGPLSLVKISPLAVGAHSSGSGGGRKRVKSSTPREAPVQALPKRRTPSVGPGTITARPLQRRSGHSQRVREKPAPNGRLIAVRSSGGKNVSTGGVVDGAIGFLDGHGLLSPPDALRQGDGYERRKVPHE
mgnify:CR=1 FL=1